MYHMISISIYTLHWYQLATQVHPACLALRRCWGWQMANWGYPKVTMAGIWMCALGWNWIVGWVAYCQANPLWFRINNGIWGLQFLSQLLFRCWGNLQEVSSFQRGLNMLKMFKAPVGWWFEGIILAISWYASWSNQGIPFIRAV